MKGGLGGSCQHLVPITSSRGTGELEGRIKCAYLSTSSTSLRLCPGDSVSRGSVPRWRERVKLSLSDRRTFSAPVHTDGQTPVR